MREQKEELGKEEIGNNVKSNEYKKKLLKLFASFGTPNA